MVGQLHIVDAIMLQWFQKTGAVEILFGDFVFTIQLPKSLIQRMIYLVKFMRAGDAKLF